MKLVTPLLLIPASMLSGCWMPPVASVQPQGEARLIESGILVESAKPPAIVEAVDRSAGTVAVRIPGAPAAVTYKAGREIENLGELRMGDRVKPTVREELSVYVLRDGRAPAPDGTLQKIDADARVLSVDPSYRLLQVQYPDGARETLKVALGVRLEQMEAGDAVVIRPVEAVRLSEKRW